MESFDLRTAASLIPVMDCREETVEKMIDAIELYDSCLKEDMRYASQIETLFVDLTISQANSNPEAYSILKPLNEQIAIKKFADGLRNRRLSTIISARNYSELKDAVRAAEDEEVSQPLPSTSNSMLSMRGKSYGPPTRGRGNYSHRGYRGNPNNYARGYNNNSRTYFNNNYNYRGRQTRGVSTQASRGRVTRSRGYSRNIHFAQQEPAEGHTEPSPNNQEPTNTNNNRFFRD
ncbi:uncharacterized protein [Choristoneura fumiferana]|uniref:uncharacterized protein n=1 Tax=Choristoneura fumiferana TaxID=7141 RepID=UPI003D15EB9C